MDLFLTSQISGEEACVCVTDRTTFAELRGMAAEAFHIADPTHIALLCGGEEHPLDEQVSGAPGVEDGSNISVAPTREFLLQKIASSELDLRACPVWASSDSPIATEAVIRKATAWHAVHTSLLQSRDFLLGAIIKGHSETVDMSGFTHHNNSLLSALNDRSEPGYRTALLALSFGDIPVSDESFYALVATTVSHALPHIPAELLGNKRFMLSLCSTDKLLHRIAECALPSLLADDDFLLQMATLRGQALGYLPPRASHNPAIVEAAIRSFPGAARAVPDEMLREARVLRAVLQCDPLLFRSIRGIDRGMLQDEAFLLSCLETAGAGQLGFMRHIPHFFEPTEGFSARACAANGAALQHLCSAHRSCKEVAMAAVTDRGVSLRYVTTTTPLCVDRELLEAAVGQAAVALCGAHRTVRRSPACLMILLRVNPEAMRYVLPAPLHAKAHLGKDWESLPACRLRASECFMLESIDLSPECIRYAAPSLRHSYDFIAAAVARSAALQSLLLAGFGGCACEVGSMLPREAFREARRLRLPLRHVARLSRDVVGPAGVLPSQRVRRARRLRQLLWEPGYRTPRG